MKAKPTKDSGKIVLELSPRDEPLMTAASADRSLAAFRLKRILVPVDFSDCARKALRYAVPLARQHHAAITLLYAVPPIYSVGEYGGLNYTALLAEMHAAGQAQLVVLAEDEAESDLFIDRRVCHGTPGAEIINAARDLPADMIVISTHGRTGLRHALLGSVTEHVVRHAPCPVLVVREHEHEFIAP